MVMSGLSHHFENATKLLMQIYHTLLKFCLGCLFDNVLVLMISEL